MLEKLYTVREIAQYFGVTETTVLRWIGDYNATKNLEPQNRKGLRAGKLNGVYRARESWIKDYARNLYAQEGKS